MRTGSILGGDGKISARREGSQPILSRENLKYYKGEGDDTMPAKKKKLPWAVHFYSANNNESVIIAWTSS